MKKSILSFILSISVLLSLIISNANAYEVGWEYLWSNNTKNLNGQESYIMLASLGINTQSYEINLYLPEHGDTYPLHSIGPNISSPEYYEYIATMPIGSVDYWKTIYEFQISDGTTYSYDHSSNEFIQMEIPTIDITDGAHPTISWSSVPYADNYVIRFQDPTDGKGVLFEKFASDILSYNYNGDLFQQYGELIVRLEARDYDSSQQLVNRSQIFVSHAVPIPASIILLSSALGALGIIRRANKGPQGISQR